MDYLQFPIPFKNKKSEFSCENKEVYFSKLSRLESILFIVLTHGSINQMKYGTLLLRYNS